MTAPETDFPGLNEFIYPVLESLSEHWRMGDEVVELVVKRLRLSPRQLQLTNARGQPLLNYRFNFTIGRLAKAGFVMREQDELGVRFKLSGLGNVQLRRSARNITWGYLQAFSEGVVYRGSSSNDTQSEAELILLDALGNLPEPYKVFHSVKWLAHSTQQGSEGEIDFLVAHPQHGLLVIEVKGGEIDLETQGNATQWFSVNRYRERIPINDPVMQAERNLRHLRAWLVNDQRTTHHSYTLFHAVAFPDTRVDKDIRPDCPQAIVIDARDVRQIERKIESIFAYWKQRANQKNQSMGGAVAVQALRQLLVPTLKLETHLSSVFERERCAIEALTQRQFHILSTLQAYRRAVIMGGAGTGKTMLAMEKGRQLALAGFRVLFLAFNKQITRWIKRHLSDEHITVATFHGFVQQAREWAGLPRPQGFDRSADELIEASQVLRIKHPERLYDALIVDEGQDFDATWWIALREMLKSQQHGILYIFLDDSQMLYQRTIELPSDMPPPLYLVENCRNTRAIHQIMQRYSKACETYCDGPDGRPVHHIQAVSSEQQREELRRLCHHLFIEQHLPSHEVVLLSPIAEKRSQWKEGMRLGNFTLTWNLEADGPHWLKVATIQSYKGLETSIVILTELENTHREKLNELLYVGLSRARNDVYVIGPLPGPS